MLLIRRKDRKYVLSNSLQAIRHCKDIPDGKLTKENYSFIASAMTRTFRVTVTEVIENDTLIPSLAVKWETHVVNPIYFTWGNSAGELFVNETKDKLELLRQRNNFQFDLPLEFSVQIQESWRSQFQWSSQSFEDPIRVPKKVRLQLKWEKARNSQRESHNTPGINFVSFTSPQVVKKENQILLDWGKFWNPRKEHLPMKEKFVPRRFLGFQLLESL